MNNKKLIGTILGVIAFVALIAGATFAWFSAAVSVTNGTYNATAQNFVINYTKGTDIESVPIVASGTASNATSLVVSAYRAATTATGQLELKLTTSSNNTLTTSGAIHYAVCEGAATNPATTAKCTGSLETANSNNVLATGTVTANGTKTLYTASTIATTATYYHIFFWIDGDDISNDHLGQSYAGYIHAKATQN